MARNKLTDLNDHLFIQLERLNDEDKSKEDMALEVKKAIAMSKIASQVISNAKVSIDIAKLTDECKIEDSILPDYLKLKNSHPVS